MYLLTDSCVKFCLEFLFEGLMSKNETYLRYIRFLSMNVHIHLNINYFVMQKLPRIDVKGYYLKSM